MSDPTNKRDQRREARRQHIVQRQTERRRERQQAIRLQRIQRLAIIVGVAIVLALLIWGIVAFATTPHTRSAPMAPGERLTGYLLNTTSPRSPHNEPSLSTHRNGDVFSVLASHARVAQPVALDASDLTWS